MKILNLLILFFIKLNSKKNYKNYSNQPTIKIKNFNIIKKFEEIMQQKFNYIFGYVDFEYKEDSDSFVFGEEIFFECENYELFLKIFSNNNNIGEIVFDENEYDSYEWFFEIEIEPHKINIKQRSYKEFREKKFPFNGSNGKCDLFKNEQFSEKNLTLIAKCMVRVFPKPKFLSYVNKNGKCVGYKKYSNGETLLICDW